MKQIPDEIKAGMALLDEKAPGWREKIDLEELDLGECHACILGQVFGHYNAGKRALAEADNEPVRYGFDCHPTNYDLLTQAWKEALSEPSSPSAA